MRVSCNGCRVLRKGCSDNCTIRPCLHWIKTPESQANATVFLAKFYGRAGLQNLINAGPEDLRPAVFRSLLYESCGRIVNPIYGAAGLLWSGNWNLCHAAVEAVLSGAPIEELSPESAAGAVSPPLKACDIRHVKDDGSDAARELHRVRNKMKFKRAGSPAGGAMPKVEVEPSVDEAAAQVMWSWSNMMVIDQSGSHESGLSHEAQKVEAGGDTASAETVEPSLTKEEAVIADGGNVELELTLGMEPVAKEEKGQGLEMDDVDAATCEIQLALNYSA